MSFIKICACKQLDTILCINVAKISFLYLTNVQNCCSDSVSICDGLSSSSQHGGFQSAWMGTPGQVSMADIVKMGRPQAKASMPNSSIHSGNRQNVFAPPAASHHNLHSLQSHASKVSETNNDQGFAINDNVQQNDEWPSIEHQPAVCVSSAVDGHTNSEYNTNSSNFGEANRQLKTNVNECATEDSPVENPDNVGSTSISAKSLSEDNPESASVFDGSLYKDINSYQPHRHPFDDNEGDEDAYDFTCLVSSFLLNIYVFQKKLINYHIPSFSCYFCCLGFGLTAHARLVDFARNVVGHRNNIKR